MPQDVDAIAEARGLYKRLLNAWNDMSATDFATLFASDGNVVGIVREVRFISDDVVVVRAVAGMVPRGGIELNENLAIQSLVVTKDAGRWKIALWHKTPAACHGR